MSKTNKKVLTLYGTTACHLCELAEEMVAGVVAANGDVQVEKVDISESDALFERYGVRIPVLAVEDGSELGWPFSVQQLEVFLRGLT
ncbi:MAG: glutaredoxin family protein [Pseudomonadota bacterium]